MPTSAIQTSFAAGEVSKTLYGRVDLSKYSSGAEEVYNFFVDYRGGVTTRPGTSFVAVARTPGNVRLVPFQFSADQTYVLEFGPRYMRVIQNGGLVLGPIKDFTQTAGVITVPAHGYEVDDWIFLPQTNQTYIVTAPTTDTFTLRNTVGDPAFTARISGKLARIFSLKTPYESVDIPSLKFSQSADVMTITHQDHAPRDLNRLANDNWNLTVVRFGTTVPSPEDIRLKVSDLDGNATYSYTVTAIDAGGQESSAGEPGGISDVVNISETQGSMIIQWDAVATADYYNVFRASILTNDQYGDNSGDPNLVDVKVPIGSTYGFIGTAYGLQFIDTNIVPDFTQTPPKFTNPFADGFIKSVTVTSGGTGYTGNERRMVVVSDTVAGGSGFIGRPIIVAGEVTGVYIENPGQNYTAPTMKVQGANVTATFSVEVGPSSGNFPRSSGYYQQRKIYASTLNEPQTLWGSKPGNFKNFDVSIPTNDGDSFEFSLVSQQVNYIKHLVQMPTGLIILTASGAWQLSGGGDNAPLTATNAVATPQAFIGASDVEPLLINYDLVYTQAKGGTVRSLAYNFVSNAYTGQDLSILSNHLFENDYITSWCYADEPYKLVWAVLDNGKLLAFTYLKDQEVYAWSRCETQGQYKAVCQVQEGNNDVVYYVVKRLVGDTLFQYIEQQQPRRFENAEDAWCVDCGVMSPTAHPNGALSISKAQGSVLVQCSLPEFLPGMVGWVLRVGGGRGVITAVNNENEVRVNFTRPITETIPFTSTPRVFSRREWSIAPIVSEITGLDHLEGLSVAIFADGNVRPKQQVVGGKVTLDPPASRVIVGLGYQARLRTLPLETQPTIQGKRKNVNAVTVKVSNTRGLKTGKDYDSVRPFKERGQYPMGQELPLFTGEQRFTLANDWDTNGQISFTQDEPLPATILAVTYEVTVGDN